MDFNPWQLEYDNIKSSVGTTNVVTMDFNPLQIKMIIKTNPLGIIYFVKIK